TSRSTVYGLGYLSGRAIKRLGEAVLNGVDYILINRQLKRMESHFASWWDEESSTTREMCRLLIEFTHPGYVLSVRTRALCLIMNHIGTGKFKGLVGALEDINSASTYYRHLSEVWDCVNGIDAAWEYLQASPKEERALHGKTFAHLSAVRKAYLSASRFGTLEPYSRDLYPILYQNVPLMLYFAFNACHRSSVNARILADIGVMERLESTGLFDPPNNKVGIVAGKLLLRVIHLHLDPEYDWGIKERIGEFLLKLEELHVWTSLSRNTGLTEETWRLLRDTSLDVPPGDLRNAILKFITTGSRAAAENPVKLLLLGIGASGKSTIKKQLTRSYHGASAFRTSYFNPDLYQRTLYEDVLFIIRELIKTPRGSDALALHKKAALTELVNVDGIDELYNLITTSAWGFKALQAIANEDERTRLRAFRHFAELSPSERESYEPRDEDLLRGYIASRELHEEIFLINDRVYSVFDCGGVRSERKKWIHMFDNVGVIVMVVSLDYDSCLLEQRNANRMEESITLFEAICGSRWFIRTKLILAFTKLDSLEEKLRTSPLERLFPDYTGAADVQLACEYFKQRFLKISKGRGHAITVVHFMNIINQAEVEEHRPRSRFWEPKHRSAFLLKDSAALKRRRED
ncbi:guanine nucleotide-binding protein subunit alpha, partial [Marasmius crinis-equi]